MEHAQARRWGAKPSTEAGLLIYVMVDSVAETIDAVLVNGGKVVQPLGFDAPELTARISDPAGNVIGLYQEPSRAGTAFVICRVFDAPCRVVWRAWTEAERLKQWFGPKGFTMPYCKLDSRPGGMLHYQLRSADGKEMWGKFIFREIEAPHRLVFVNCFSDEKGGMARHPLSPAWPLEMLSSVTFAEHEGKTAVTVRWEPLNSTAEERKTFDSSHDGMRQGWSGTFEQLKDYLAKL